MSERDDELGRRDLIAGVAATSAVLTLGCESRKPMKTTAANEHAESSVTASTEAANEALLQPVMTVRRTREKHWVGDGFPVRTLFSPSLLDPDVLSPFILLDHAEPYDFSPSERRRGVGEHPHRGFETVTFAYQGEIDHRDSHGGGGRIGPGDIQWMTAGSGVVHEEFHSPGFTRTGGKFEMVQLWVNLPARLKMTEPRYQELLGATFPKLELGAGANARLIAGELMGQSGPALTYSPIRMLDIDFDEVATATLDLPPMTTTLLLGLRGSAKVQGEHDVSLGDLVVMDRDQPGVVKVEGNPGARLLVLNGEPLNEPVVAHGPFVMNTREEIRQAIRDYQRGMMGTLRPTT